MKILYISLSPDISTRGSSRLTGARARIEGVMNALQRLGHQVSSVIAGNVFPQCRSGSSWWVHGALRISLYWIIDLYLCLRILVAKPDIIYECYVPLRGRPLFRDFFKGRYLVEYHGIPSLDQSVLSARSGFQKLVRRRERASIDAADMALFVSDAMRSVFLDHVGAAQRERAVVVPHAVDVSKFILPDTRSAQPFRFIFVGNLASHQRLDLLLEALARMGGRSCVEAVIIGDGAQLETLRQLRDDLGLSAQVSIPGFLTHEQVIAEMLRANCGYSVQGEKALGGQSYTSSLKLYEYLAAGLPFISQWQAEGAALAKQLGTQNLLCEPTVDGVYLSMEAAVEVFSDEDVVSAFAEKAHALARAEHSWERRMRSVIGPATQQ